MFHLINCLCLSGGRGRGFLKWHFFQILSCLASPEAKVAPFSCFEFYCPTVSLFCLLLFFSLRSGMGLLSYGFIPNHVDGMGSGSVHLVALLYLFPPLHFTEAHMHDGRRPVIIWDFDDTLVPWYRMKRSKDHRDLFESWCV